MDICGLEAMKQLKYAIFVLEMGIVKLDCLNLNKHYRVLFCDSLMIVFNSIEEYYYLH